jgi:hypothetical protein
MLSSVEPVASAEGVEADAEADADDDADADGSALELDARWLDDECVEECVDEVDGGGGVELVVGSSLVEEVVGSGVQVVVGSGFQVVVGSGVQVVVGSGFQVVVGSGFQVVVGLGSSLVVGSGFQVVVGLGSSLVVGPTPPPPEPSLNVHEPVMTPASSLAKNLKRPRDKSRPPYGHPGHCHHTLGHFSQEEQKACDIYLIHDGSLSSLAIGRDGDSLEAVWSRIAAAILGRV